MRLLGIVAVVLASVHPAAAQREYPRELFNTAQPVTGATPFANYDPYRLDELYRKRHETEI
jgi:hypothetical protein